MIVKLNKLLILESTDGESLDHDSHIGEEDDKAGMGTGVLTGIGVAATGAAAYKHKEIKSAVTNKVNDLRDKVADKIKSPNHNDYQTSKASKEKEATDFENAKKERQAENAKTAENMHKQEKAQFNRWARARNVSNIRKRSQ